VPGLLINSSPVKKSVRKGENKMSERKRIGLFILLFVVPALVGMGLVTGWLPEHAFSNERMSRRPAEPRFDESQAGVSVPPGSKDMNDSGDGMRGGFLESSAHERPVVLSLSVRENIMKCVKGVAAFRGITRTSDFATLDDLLKNAVEHSTHTSNERVRYHNVHIRTKDGELLRLRAAPPKTADGHSDVKLDVRIFAVDNENLPIPRELPKSLKGLSVDQAIAEFRDHGTVTLDEVSYSQELTDGAGASVIASNGLVRELQFYFDGKTLGCATDRSTNVSCRCF
jgi:hypothetical protein